MSKGRCPAVLLAAALAVLDGCAAPAGPQRLSPSPTHLAGTPQPTTSAATRAYVLEVEELAFNLTDAAAELSRLVAQPRPGDAAWAAAAAQQMAAIQQVYAYARAIRPPDDLRHVHAIVVEATLDARAACDLILGSGGRGTDACAQAAILFGRAAARMKEATGMVEEYMRLHD